MKLAVAIFALVILFAIISWGFGWFSDAGNVAQKELSASALLKKYTWFKEASAQLDAKRASIEVLKSSLNNLEFAYGNKSREQWARNDREAYNVKSQEIAGTIASYNTLAAEYNAKMVEIQWRFTNVGDMPKGFEGDRPLPREYKPYMTET